MDRVLGRHLAGTTGIGIYSGATRATLHFVGGTSARSNWLGSGAGRTSERSFGAGTVATGMRAGVGATAATEEVGATAARTCGAFTFGGGRRKRRVLAVGDGWRCACDAAAE